MAGDILLGIDLGTTVLKAAVVEAHTGRLLGTASRRLPLRSGADGKREQELPTVDRSLSAVIGELRASLGQAWQRVAGIGLASQGGSAIIADRHTGKALTPMQLWNDVRPLHLLKDIAARKSASYWQRVTYLSGPGAGLARICWLRERHPRLFNGDNIYVGGGEYVFFRLTGVWRQDAGNALQIGCYDARHQRLMDETLRLAGVTSDFVAPMRRGHEMHGLSPAGAKLLGLSPGIPVVGPYIDHEAGYLSAVGTSSRPLQCSLGTAWVGNFVHPKGPPPPGALQLMLPSPVAEGSLILRVMPAGNVTWDWALGAFVDRDHGRALAKADAIFRRQLLPSAGLVSLPWLTRPNLFDPRLAGSGGFLGINAHSSPQDLLRATAAGMCFEFARLFERVRDSGIADSVVLGGGASRGWCFRTLMAGLFAPLPVYRLDGPDQETAGPRGTIYAFSPRAARARTRRVPAPGAALAKQIRRQFELYCRACHALRRGLPDRGGDLLIEQRKRR